MRFYILGPLRVHREDGQPCRLDPRQSRVLAVLLLSANRTISRQHLIDAVWDDDPPTTATRQIQNCISALRRRAIDIIAADGPNYRIRIGTDHLDVDVFQSQITAAQDLAARGRAGEAVQRFRAALSLWQGPALSGLGGRLIEAATARLDERRLTTTEKCLELELELGHEDNVVDELTELVAAHPLRERLVGQLMLALHRCGRQAEALAAYQRLRAKLSEELGLNPGLALQELHTAILRNEIAASPVRTTVDSPAVPRQLPLPVRHFVGRGAELKDLTQLLDEAASRAGAVVISAIDGTGGIGKTALALHWAHRIASRFPDGQLYVNLRGFDPSGAPMTAAEAVRRLLDAFSVPPQQIPASLDAQAALFRSLIADKRMLVVLDNARDVDQVRPLLPGNATCLALVTSRSRLTSLIAVEGAHPITLDLLTYTESYELLARHLGPERLERDPTAVDELVTRCARLPLALAIVAAHAATQPSRPLSTFVTELVDTRRRLDILDAGDRATQVRAVFSWSYERLSPPAARLFRLLGIHPGPDISTAAAASLAGHPPAETRILLGELTRAHVLVEHVPGRYTFHDLLRAYAAERASHLDPEEERHTATVRVLDHYLHTAYEATRLLNPNQDPITPAPPESGTNPEALTNHEQALRWFATEHAVLLAVVAHAAQTGHDTHTWQLAWAFVNYFDRRGHWHDLVTTQRLAVGAARRLADPHAQARAHRNLAIPFSELGRFDDAHHHLGLALGLYQECKDLLGQAYTHNNLAYLWERQGRHAEALAHVEQALDLHQSAGQTAGEATALNAIGWLQAQLGNYPDALHHCEQALARFHELDDPYGQAGTWDSLGYIHHHLGHHEQATACYEQSLALHRSLGNRVFESTALIHLGDAHLGTGQFDAARAAWQQALAILEDLEHPAADQVRTKLGMLPASA